MGFTSASILSLAAAPMQRFRQARCTLHRPAITPRHTSKAAAGSKPAIGALDRRASEPRMWSGYQAMSLITGSQFTKIRDWDDSRRTTLDP